MQAIYTENPAWPPRDAGGRMRGALFSTDELPLPMVTTMDVAKAARNAGLHECSIVVKGVGLPGWDAVRIAPDRDLYPASMIKTPLVAAALADVEDGRLHLEDRVEVHATNMTHNDAPSPLVAGYWATLEEVCSLAISRSDNVATNMLFDLVGRERATTLVRDRFGLGETAFHRKLSGADPLIDDPGWDGVHRNRHTASDAAHLFELVALDRVPHGDLIRRALAEQYWNDKLSRGLEPGDRFAHKTGDTSDVTHDGGILRLPNGHSTVVVVYTGMASTDENNAKFAPFMRALVGSL